MNVGATVRVSGGKYDGQQGTINSVAAHSCKLRLANGTITGSIKKASLAVISASSAAPVEKVFTLAIGASQHAGKEYLEAAAANDVDIRTSLTTLRHCYHLQLTPPIPTTLALQESVCATRNSSTETPRFALTSVIALSPRSQPLLLALTFSPDSFCFRKRSSG
jgi:hypothetical protein